MERLTETQRRILTVLCRPCAGESRFARPASNSEIAGEVFLSVDAVKAHLRALYKKFGVESLPHTEKRTALVEIVLGSGLLDAGETPIPMPPRGRRAGAERRTMLVSFSAVAALALGGLALSGATSGDSAGSPAGPIPSRAEYTRAVDSFCRMALGDPGPGSRDRAALARAHLREIETVRGRVDSLTPPAGRDRALTRFRRGLERAADYTSAVAEAPPPAGSGRGAGLVAELTLAAGQVEAGALGYGLGPPCLAVGDVVAASARNAAGPPP